MHIVKITATSVTLKLNMKKKNIVAGKTEEMKENGGLQDSTESHSCYHT
jgi:hypothetical protein